MEILKKAQSWYNPMSIGTTQFNEINILDGKEILHTFNWFNRYEGSSNATDLPIKLNATLKRSSINGKHKLSYRGAKGVYSLNIDKSLIPFKLVNHEIYEYDSSRSEGHYYKLDNHDCFFSVRTPLHNKARQTAYMELYEKLDKLNNNLSLRNVTQALQFYNENKKLFEVAEILKEGDE